MTEETQPPLLRVISPSATPEEIAAIVAVVSAMAGSAAPTRRPVREWASPGRVLRPPHHAGRGAWRASALPR